MRAARICAEQKAATLRSVKAQHDIEVAVALEQGSDALIALPPPEDGPPDSQDAFLGFGRQVGIIEQGGREVFQFAGRAGRLCGGEHARVGADLEEVLKIAPKRLGQQFQSVNGGGSFALFPRAVGALLYAHTGGHLGLGEALSFAQGVELCLDRALGHLRRDLVPEPVSCLLSVSTAPCADKGSQGLAGRQGRSKDLLKLFILVAYGRKIRLGENRKNLSGFGRNLLKTGKLLPEN